MNKFVLLFGFVETASLYIVLVVLELTDQTRLACSASLSPDWQD